MSSLRSSREVFELYLLSIVFCSSIFQVNGRLHQLLFVKANNSHQRCPNNTEYTRCQTFSFYYKNLSLWCQENTEMLFEEGVHLLDEFVNASNCHNFTMTGTSRNASWFSDILPNPRCQIRCQGSNTGLYFEESATIHVSNLKFESCGGSLQLKTEKRVQLASALAFVSAQDLIIDNVLIINARGYALYTNNCFGMIMVTNSAFICSKSHPFANESGNANFRFQDSHKLNASSNNTNLTIESSSFMYGERSSSLFIGAAGGINVYINSVSRVSVVIFNVTARGNKGTNGNFALYIGDQGIGRGSSIVINNSHILDGYGIKGGGLRFWSHYSHKSAIIPVKSSHHEILTVINSVFHNNSGHNIGGAMYIGYYNNGTIENNDGTLRQTTIRNCNFTKNSGNGAAMEIIEHLLSARHAIPLFQTSIENCIFDRNFRPDYVDGPIVDLISVDVTISNSIFRGSNASVLTLRNTYLNLRNEVVFKNNTALIGAAIKLCDSSLIFGHNGTNVTFENNRARKGGAIYIQQSCMDTSSLCFFQPHFPKSTYIEDFRNLVSLTFKNNVAEIVGDDIYGGELDRCSTIVPFKSKSDSIHSSYLPYKEIIQEVFHMQGEIESRIASNPLQACLCPQEDDRVNFTCKNKLHQIYVYPGEHFELSMVTVGQMNSSAFGTINATLRSENTSNHVLDRKKNLIPSTGCTTYIFSVKSNHKSAQIDFTAYTSELATRYKIETLTLHVNLLQCPIGFELSQSPHYKCICSSQLTKYLLDHTRYAYSPVLCNITSRVISVPQGRLWFGCFDPSYKNDTTNCTSLALTPNCNYYCSRHPIDIINVSISNLDSQCSPHHTGVMCGACQKGYSRILGNVYECRKDCNNTNLIFLVPLFFASGFILVIVIMALNLTVTEGTLNGLLVYTMVIQTPNSYFPNNPTGLGNFCLLFISWINLTFGIKACFYEGMDGYQYTWVLFAHIFYLLFVQVVIIFLTRKFIFFTRLFGRNIIKVLATLFFLQYSNIIFAVSRTMQYATIHYSTANSTLPSKLVWYFDGNVPYLGLKHAPLFIMGMFWLVVLFLFVFSLLMIQCLQKQASLWCCRWTVRLRPFYEAFTGPCRDSYRFWPGFLLLIRSGLYLLNFLVPTYSDVFYQIKMFVTAAFCVVVMSLACIFPHGVYKRWPLNILEFSFFLNLCITSGILGVRSPHRSQYIVYTSVCIAAATFLGILLYYIHSQINNTKTWRKITARLHVYKKRIFKMKRSAKSIDSNEFEDTDTNEADHLLPHPLPPVVKFDHLREPLVES